ncbi:LytR/AlgR family response regulator transcription factor [Saccharopolyspora mangrovi]|uniref:LytR/AlgR family response regulator transcription factor n=1 Tax=Saccharopolyspora mangrovi TaxID=3082379 RepID=UPI002B4BCABE|nr:LytTR family DNA-binding domain-containing protein [Saccharopolyspora sp. S2-29]
MESNRRVIAIKGNRRILLAVSEVVVAESAGNTVWLRTDLGRFRCAVRGLGNIAGQFSECGFMRVHRSYLVNLSRVREVERRDSGELELTVDDNGTTIPVSRSRAKVVAAALGVGEILPPRTLAT